MTQHQQFGRMQLPELPSSRFQFSVWHDLKTSDVHGVDLKAPRIRLGPNVKDIKLYEAEREYEDVESIHHNLEGREKRKHRDLLENWEKAELASFGYQQLQHGYQKKNLYRILDRLRNVKHLNLAHNDISNINSYSFPQCSYLNLNNNYISSFTCLPKLKMVTYLTLIDNDITSLSGLKSLRSSGLEELYLNGNPVSFTDCYRQRVFAILPNLKVLDGVYQQKTDFEFPETDKPRTCSIS